MKAALLVIDTQVGLFEGLYQPEQFLQNVQTLIAKARANNAPVVYIQDDDIGGVDSEAWQVHPEVAPQPDDVRVRKLAADSFHGSSLQEELEARSITHLVICGLKTQFCVDITSRAAALRSYHVTLAADAHATSDNQFLKAADAIAYHNAILDGMYTAHHGFGDTYQGITVEPVKEISFEKSHP
jgi:nicotinamidase-related amidase